MTAISSAFRAFFSLLLGKGIPSDIALKCGYVRKDAPKKAAGPVKEWKPADGAMQMLGILQRDARLIDFLMEDISGYSDDQVGAAVRDMQRSARETLERYLKLAPVIDSVEDTYTRAEGVDPAAVKFIGNVPAQGQAAGGKLRHKGWRAEHVSLPALAGGANPSVLAQAEIEIE